MARVLMMTTKEKGHLNPMMAVAQWLRLDGHEVAWLCLPEAPSYLSELRFASVALPRPEAREQESEPLVTGGPELAALVRDPAALREWIRHLLIATVPALVEPVRGVLRSWRPDVLATDPMLYGGIIAAHLERVPYACISSSLNPVTPPECECPHAENMRALDPERRELFARYGLDLDFRVADCLSPHLNVVFSTPDYIGGDIPLPLATVLVGPAVPPERRGDEVELPWSLLDDRPLVYASFGSQIYYQPTIFERLAAATAPLGVRLVISCGPLAGDPWAASLPPHVLTVGYTPQRQLLARTRVFITHGGANSVMEAITAGVPLIISPVCNDQPMQAFFLRRRGVGRELDLATAGTEQVAAAVAALLREDAPERQAMERASASYGASDGGRRAAELVAGLAG